MISLTNVIEHASSLGANQHHTPVHLLGVLVDEMIRFEAPL